MSAPPVAEASSQNARPPRFLVLSFAVLAVFLASRLVLVAVGGAALLWKGMPFASAADLVSLFVRWDGFWYLGIAEHGYSTEESLAQLGATNYAFFPLLPLAINGAKTIFGISTAAAGVLIANGAFLLSLAAVLSYGLVLGLSERAAILTIVLISAVPHSFIFSAIYSESLFLLLLAGAMLTLRLHRYWLSGILAALLSAARPNGFMFLIFAVAHLFRRDHARKAVAIWREPQRYIPIVMAPLGLFGFWWFSFLTTGDAFATVTTNSAGWSRSIDWPWVIVILTFSHIGIWTYPVASSLAFFGPSLLLLKYRYFEEFIFCLGCFVMYWSAATIPLSLVRFSVVVWPIYIGLACAFETRPRLAAAVTAGFAGWNVFLMIGWALADSPFAQ